MTQKVIFPIQHKRVVSELNDLKVDRESVLQKNHELLAQLKTVRRERAELEGEAVTLRGNLQDAEHSAG